MNPLTTVLDAAAICAIAFLAYRYLNSRSPWPLPPGPRRLPLIGNLFDVPRDFPWKRYAEWAQKYGSVISLSVPGQTIIVLNSYEAIKSIVLARQTHFSGRPFIQFVEMAGWYRSNLPLMNSGHRWKERRRVVETYFRPTLLQNYQHTQAEKIIKLVKRISEEPNELPGYIREYAGAVVMDVVYGYDAKDSHDHFIRINELFNELAPSVIYPGALIVNTFPFLGRLPPWMLGKKFVTVLDMATRLHTQMIEEPFKWVKDNIRNGTARESLVRNSLSNMEENSGEEEEVIADAFGNVYAAAIDTTTSTLLNFTLTMILNPDIQAKARQQLDSVVGRDRLPEFSDRPNLPYIEAILKEVLRWEPTTPLGLAHTTDEDVILDRFFIPKGSIVFGNTWAILHDPERYPEPDIFKPERHLSANGRIIEDPLLEYAFGFGSRRCPGRHFADAMIWLYIVSLLALFDIRKAKDKYGNEIPVSEEFEAQSVVHRPLPFSCALVPRDERAAEFIARL